MSLVSFSVRDHSDEYSSVGFNITDVDETSWVATNTAIAAIQTALAALTTGNIASKTLVAYNTKVDDTRPANPYAQRETGLRLFYQDDVTFKKSHITVPAPDLLVVASGGTDEVDLSGVAVVNAVVTALEAIMKSPEGNAVTFYRGLIVGRRS